MDINYIKGVVVPILLPIDDDENVDKERLCRQIDYVIDGGVDGILLFGSNGEFYAVEDEEMPQIIELVRDKIDKRVPLFVGIGGITTKKCIKLAKMANELCVQGICLLQPMYIAPNDDELYTHYKTVADAVPDLAVLIYNNPRVGYGIKPVLGYKLAKEVDNIVGVKDSSGNMTTLCEFVRLTRELDFKVFAGKDTMIMPSLAGGAVGCVATTANFVPQYVCDIYHKFMEGDIVGAREAQFRLTPIRNALDLTSFPAGTKDIANIMGMDVGKPYLPNKSASGVVKEKMVEILKEEGII